MNDDASTFDLPEYIHSRLQPQILIDFPERDEEYQILQGESALRRRPHPAPTSPISCSRRTPPTSATRVRDGINIARFAIKLKSLATGSGRTKPKRSKSPSIETLGEEALRYARRNRPSLPDFWQPDARPLHLLPGGARTPGVRHRGAAAHPARPARRSSRSNCPPRCDRSACAPSPACRRCRSSSITTRCERSRTTDQAVYVPVEPADPFTEAIRTALGDRRRRSSSPTPTPASARTCTTTYPDPYAIRHIGPLTSTSRRIASIRSRAPTTSTAHAAGIAWKLQGADPAGAACMVVVSLNLLDPVLDAMEAPQAAARRAARRDGVAAAQSASRLSGRDHARVSVPAGALRNVSRGDARPIAT